MASVTYNPYAWQAARMGNLGVAGVRGGIGLGMAGLSAAGAGYGAMHGMARSGSTAFVDQFTSMFPGKGGERARRWQAWSQQLPTTRASAFKHAARGVGRAPLKALGRIGPLGLGLGAAVEMALGEGSMARRATAGVVGMVGADMGMFAGAAIGTAILPGIGTVIGGAIGMYFGYEAGAGAAGGMYDIGSFMQGKRRGSPGLEFRGDLTAFMTGGALTMRQQSVMAIQRGSINTRQAISNEATYMHFR